MRTAAIFCLLLLWDATFAHATLSPVNYAVHSVKSHIFAPLRPNRPPLLIRASDRTITEPFGLLEHTFRRGEVPEGTTCTFKLRAPVNYRVNIITVAFDLTDAKYNEYRDNKQGKISMITLYDSKEPGRNSMTGIRAEPIRRFEGFVNSISSKENMVVQIQYHDNVNYATQRFRITYEFLDFDKMMELLTNYG